MSNLVFTGSAISELVALIEKHVCHTSGCDHLGEPCERCGAYVCTAHCEKCGDCGGLYCTECTTFHPVYCEKKVGEATGDGADPIHDHRREVLRVQDLVPDQER